MTIEVLKSYDKEELNKMALSLNKEDIKQLIEWLTEKDDKIRYPAFLLLQSRSKSYDDIYPYFDIFTDKLKSENSYQRSIGLMLLAQNARWDEAKKIDKVINTYLEFCDDEKPMVVRLCIQGLANIVHYKEELCDKIVDKLTSIDISKRQSTQQKLLLLDILNILLLIKTEVDNKKIEVYINNIKNDNKLDKKIKKEVEKLLNQEA